MWGMAATPARRVLRRPLRSAAGLLGAAGIAAAAFTGRGAVDGAADAPAAATAQFPSAPAVSAGQGEPDATSSGS
ncbi:hypothetical protein SAMN05444695_101192 [Rhodococcus triatomae]|uniref:Uncharacterized protein n=2 Tax=Rhodococcus triatomae TaxID=300028 RepID=A0A1G7ZQX7_9NOCA|nr:hypothetical protein SAMN05444695_101192 [Rhodococcus triatomae]